MKRLLFAVQLGVIRRKEKKSYADMARYFGITERQYEDLEGGQHEPRAGVWSNVQDKYPGFIKNEFETWVPEEIVDIIFGRK